MIQQKNNVFQKLERHKKIRQRQVFCPVARHRVMVTPLTVADDLSLRTMISSPDIYDKELSVLIYEHCEFPDIEGNKPKYDLFIESFSHFDKKLLLWGIFDSTYNTLGEQELVCSDDKCAEKFKHTILARELIVEDTIKDIWRKPISFNDDFVEYTYTVGDEDLDRIVFNLSIPSMKKHLDILRLIDTAVLKDNMNKFGSLISRTEELCLITKTIDVFFEKEGEPTSLSTSRDVSKLIANYIPLDQISKIVECFNEEYKLLDPEFKKVITCPKCGNEFDFKIDIEVALFRSFLR